MMDWKQIIAGVVVGSIIGIAGTFFLFQGRISRLEEKILHSAIDNNQSSVLIETKNKGFDETANYWKGKWQHTEIITGGSFSGHMELDLDKASVEGWCVNPQGGITEISGILSPDGNEYTGKWHNRVTDKKGIFVLRLITPTLFQGNYAMEGKQIRQKINEWTGIKKL